MKILVMGLPGAGKTTLAKALAQQLSAAYFNADDVRTMFNDWKFDVEARHRQARRMATLAEHAIADGASYVVADFVCPTNHTRALFNPDYIIFLNTISSGRFEDTNKLFEFPNRVNYMITEWGNIDAQVTDIIADIHAQPRPHGFNDTAPTGLMVGRYQPWHAGHRALFEKILEKVGQVCICIRHTHATSEKDPLDPHTVAQYIHADLSPTYAGKYRIIITPNITGIYYGRDVGYAVEKITLDSTIEAISATNIRKEMGL